LPFHLFISEDFSFSERKTSCNLRLDPHLLYLDYDAESQNFEDDKYYGL